MKKLLVVLLAISCIFIFGAVESNQHKQWEYCCFSNVVEPISVQGFNSGNNHYWADTLEGLCDKIGIKRTGGKDETAMGLIMDYAGSQGWELTGIIKDKSYTSFWFKRPK